MHHVDDFTTAALIDCQRKAIEEPDRLVVVSEDWRDRLKADYGVDAVVIHNGVDAEPLRSDRGRHGAPPSARRAGVAGSLRVPVGRWHRTAQGQRRSCSRRWPCSRRSSIPRRCWWSSAGTRSRTTPGTATTCLATCLSSASSSGGTSILAGTVSDAELHEWYRSADALAFPSVKEGWGLAVLEAMAADLPVVSSDIAVLREYLTPGPDRGDDAGRAIRSRWLRACAGWSPTPSCARRWSEAGVTLVPAFSWERAAEEHARLYAELPH